AFAMLFTFGSGPVTTTLILTGRSRLAFIDYLFVLGTEIGLGVFLINRFGLIGAAYARLVGTAMNNVVPLIQVWMIAKIQPYRIDYWKPVVAGGLSTVVALVVVRASGLAVAAPAAVVAAGVIGVCYIGLLLLLGLSTED